MKLFPTTFRYLLYFGANAPGIFLPRPCIPKYVFNRSWRRQKLDPVLTKDLLNPSVTDLHPCPFPYLETFHADHVQWSPLGDWLASQVTCGLMRGFSIFFVSFIESRRVPLSSSAALLFYVFSLFFLIYESRSFLSLLKFKEPEL